MSSQLQIQFDVCRNRSRNNEQSASAHKRVVSGKLDRYKQIYRLLEVLGNLTAKEIAKELDRPFNTLSGRVSEMRFAGLLYDTKVRRDGGAVLGIAKKWDGETL